MKPQNTQITAQGGTGVKNPERSTVGRTLFAKENEELRTKRCWTRKFKLGAA